MTEVKRPDKITKEHLKQIIDLIKEGGEIKTPRNKLQEYLLRADLIAYKLIDNKVICTATLKNPFVSYRTRVFNSAQAKTEIKFEKELGYIVTHPEHENKGHCKKLLIEFFGHISCNSIYATTRKPAMNHILNKFNFHQIGVTYDKNLNLLVYNGLK